MARLATWASAAEAGLHTRHCATDVESSTPNVTYFSFSVTHTTIPHSSTRKGSTSFPRKLSFGLAPPPGSDTEPATCDAKALTVCARRSLGRETGMAGRGPAWPRTREAACSASVSLGVRKSIKMQRSRRSDRQITKTRENATTRERERYNGRGQGATSRRRRQIEREGRGDGVG